MGIVIMFILLYFLTGVIKIARDFVNRNIFSAEYVRHPNLGMILLVGMLWPLPIISRFIDQYRRMNLVYVLKNYVVPLFWGSIAYAASLTGFMTIFSNESTTGLKILKILGILVVFSGVIWWLYSRVNRQRRGLEKTLPTA